tara:strand:+ start:1579 stop:2187 length:609 start_codon:yes stop_codon:yes gene_type:complete
MTDLANGNLNKDNPELLDDDIEFNADYYRQDTGTGIITEDNGLAEVMLRDNKLYNSMKGDWASTRLSQSGNMKITTGRKDGQAYITREQFNIEAIAEKCRLYREAAEAGYPDPLAPPDGHGGLVYKWMDLPKSIACQIQDDYFGGLDWEVIKRDEVLKWQFYRVVQLEYPAFICYPNGKLPITKQVAYPRKMSAADFFKGGK